MPSSYVASRFSRFALTLACLLALVAGCGGGGGDTNMGADAAVSMLDGSTPTDDASMIVGPHVTSMTPTDGSLGVAEDAVFVFVFSERMDTDATQAAYVSDELPAADVNFLWNDDGDTLTVAPKEPLAYAEGDELVAALSYGMRITTAATSFDGVALAEEASLSVSTLRRIVMQPPLVAELSGRVSASGVAVEDSLQIGDSSSNIAFAGFVAFSLDSVPSGVTLESARFQAGEFNLVGDPDHDLGMLVAQHVIYSALDADAYAAALLATTPAEVNVFRMPTEVGFVRTVTLTEFVQSDLTNRASRGDVTRARLRYATATDSGNDSDQVLLDLAQATLTVTYLAE